LIKLYKRVLFNTPTLIGIFYSFLSQAIFATTAIYLSFRGETLTDSLILMGKFGSVFYLSMVVTGVLGKENQSSTFEKIYIGLFMTGVGCFFLASEAFYIDLLGLSLIGVGYGLVKPSLHAMFGETIFDKNNIKSSYSVYYSFFSIAGFLSPFAMGFLQRDFYTHVYIGFGILSLCILFLLKPLKLYDHIKANGIVYLLLIIRAM